MKIELVMRSKSGPEINFGDYWSVEEAAQVAEYSRNCLAGENISILVKETTNSGNCIYHD